MIASAAVSASDDPAVAAVGECHRRLIFLDELHHLPVGDESPLCVCGFDKESAGDHQPVRLATSRLLLDPG